MVDGVGRLIDASGMEVPIVLHGYDVNADTILLGYAFRHLFQHHIFVFAKKSSLIRHIIKLCTCLLGCGYIHAEYKRDYKRQQETAYSLFHFSALPSVPKAAAQSRRWR